MACYRRAGFPGFSVSFARSPRLPELPCEILLTKLCLVFLSKSPRYLERVKSLRLRRYCANDVHLLWKPCLINTARASPTKPHWCFRIDSEAVCLSMTLVIVLFFLRGFAYGLLDVLNANIQTVINITAAKDGGLQGAYFVIYFVGPLVHSGWIVGSLAIVGLLSLVFASTALAP